SWARRPGGGSRRRRQGVAQTPPRIELGNTPLSAVSTVCAAMRLNQRRPQQRTNSSCSWCNILPLREATHACSVDAVALHRDFIRTIPTECPGGDSSCASGLAAFGRRVCGQARVCFLPSRYPHNPHARSGEKSWISNRLESP